MPLLLAIAGRRSGRTRATWGLLKHRLTPALTDQAARSSRSAKACSNSTHQLEATRKALRLSDTLETFEARLRIARRSAAIVKRVRAAHFEQACTLEDFDFFNPKIPAAHIRDLATLRLVADGESVILNGLVGVGETMIAQALGQEACRSGCSATFTKTSRLLADLAGGHAVDRSWEPVEPITQNMHVTVALACC